MAAGQGGLGQISQVLFIEMGKGFKADADLPSRIYGMLRAWQGLVASNRLAIFIKQRKETEVSWICNLPQWAGIGLGAIAAFLGIAIALIAVIFLFVMIVTGAEKIGLRCPEWLKKAGNVSLVVIFFLVVALFLIGLGLKIYDSALNLWCH
jgi:hypothetical protein